MPQTTRKKVGAEHTLTRVRNNQRRSRARKREYITELEKKIEALEAAGTQAETSGQQSTIQRLENENKKLRGLLQDAGFSEDWMETHLQHNDDANDLKRFEEPNELGMLSTENCFDVYIGDEAGDVTTDLIPSKYGAVNTLPFDDFFTMSVLPPLGETFSLFGAPMPSISTDPFLSTTPQPTLSTPSNPCPLSEPRCASPTSNYPPTNITLSTNITLTSLKSTKSKDDLTLCTVACELVRQHNKKGIDMIEIVIRLWNGFVKGEGDGGCKVQNGLLCSVLEYVSD